MNNMKFIYVLRGPILHTFLEEAFNALNLDGDIIVIFPVKVAPSRTAIMPIKHSFLPLPSLPIKSL
jgi:hypothetical protein